MTMKENDGSVILVWQSREDIRCVTEGCIRPTESWYLLPASGGDVYACGKCDEEMQERFKRRELRENWSWK